MDTSTQNESYTENVTQIHSHRNQTTLLQASVELTYFWLTKQSLRKQLDNGQANLLIIHKHTELN